jgi:hypothetical protein
MRIALPLALATVATLNGSAQDQRQTFRSATELVEVDVRVADKDGHFVRRRRAEDRSRHADR